MAAAPVVEHFDVLEQIGLRIGPCRVGRAVHPLVLHAVEEAFGWRIVPAVALTTHRRRHAVCGEFGTCGLAGVLGGFNQLLQHLKQGRVLQRL